MTEASLTAQPLVPWDFFAADVGVDQMAIPDRLATFDAYASYFDDYAKELEAETPEAEKSYVQEFLSKQRDWIAGERETILEFGSQDALVPWSEVENSSFFQNGTNTDRLRSYYNYLSYFEEASERKASRTTEQDLPAFEEWRRSQREWLMQAADEAVEQYTLGGKLFSMSPMEQIDFLRTKDKSLEAGFTEEEWAQARKQLEDSMIPILKQRAASPKVARDVSQIRGAVLPPVFNQQRISGPRDSSLLKSDDYWRNELWNEDAPGYVNEVIERIGSESIASIMTMVAGVSDAVSRDLLVGGSGGERSDSAVAEFFGGVSDYTREKAEELREAYPFDPRYSSEERAGVSGVTQAPGQILPFLVPKVGMGLGLIGMYGQLNLETQDNAYQAALENKYKESVLNGDIPIGTPVSSWEKTLDPEVREDLRAKVAVQSAVAAIPATAMDFLTMRMLLGLQAVPGAKSAAKWMSKFRQARPGLGMAAKVGSDYSLRVAAGTGAEVVQQVISNFNAATVSKDFSLENLGKGLKEAAIGGVFGEGTMGVAGVNSSVREQNAFLWAKGVLSGSVNDKVDPDLAALRERMYRAEALGETDDPQYKRDSKVWKFKQDEANWILKAIGDPDADSKSADRFELRKKAANEYTKNLAKYLKDAGFDGLNSIPKEIEAVQTRRAEEQGRIKRAADRLRNLLQGTTAEAGVDAFEKNLTDKANRKAEEELEKIAKKQNEADKKILEFVGSVDSEGPGRADYARNVILSKFPDSGFAFSPEYKDDAVVIEILNAIEQDLITEETDLTEWLQAPVTANTTTTAAESKPATYTPLSEDDLLQAYYMAEDRAENSDDASKKELSRLWERISKLRSVLENKDSSEEQKADAVQRLSELESALLDFATVSSQSANLEGEGEQGATTESAPEPTIRVKTMAGDEVDASQKDYFDEARGIVQALQSGEMSPEEALQNVEAVRMEIEAAPELTPEQKPQWFAPFQNIPAVVEQLNRTPQDTAPQSPSPSTTTTNEQTSAEGGVATQPPNPVRLNGVSGDFVRTETGEAVFRPTDGSPETVLRVKEGSVNKDPATLTTEDFESGDGAPLVSEADKQFSVLPQNERLLRPFFRSQRPQDTQEAPSPAPPAPDLEAIASEVQANPDQHRRKQGNRKLVSREAAVTILSQLPDTLTNKDIATLAKDSGMSAVNFRKLAAMRGNQDAVASILNGDMDAELGLFNREEQGQVPTETETDNTEDPPQQQKVEDTPEWTALLESNVEDTPEWTALSEKFDKFSEMVYDLGLDADTPRRKVVSLTKKLLAAGAISQADADEAIRVANDKGFDREDAVSEAESVLSSAVQFTFDQQKSELEAQFEADRKSKQDKLRSDFEAKQPTKSGTGQQGTAPKTGFEASPTEVGRWVDAAFRAIQDAVNAANRSSLKTAEIREMLSTEDGAAEIRDRLGRMFNNVSVMLPVSDPVVRQEALEKIFYGTKSKTGEGLTKHVLADLLSNLKVTGDPFLARNNKGETVFYSAWKRHSNKVKEFMDGQSTRDMTGKKIGDQSGESGSASQAVQQEKESDSEGQGADTSDGSGTIDEARKEAESIKREAINRTYVRVITAWAARLGVDRDAALKAVANYVFKNNGMAMDTDGLGWATPTRYQVDKVTPIIEPYMEDIRKDLAEGLTKAVSKAVRQSERMGAYGSGPVIDTTFAPTLEQLIELGVRDQIDNADFYDALKEAKDKKSVEPLKPILAEIGSAGSQTVAVVAGVVLNGGKPITDPKRLASLNKEDMQAILDSGLLPNRMRQVLQTLTDLSGEDALGLVRKSSDEGFRRLAEIYASQIGNGRPVEVVFNLALDPAAVAQGLWNTGDNKVHVSPFLTREKGLMEATILHEAMHPIWDRKISNYLDGKLGSLTNKEIEALEELERLFLLARAESSKRTDLPMRDLTGVRDMREFLNEALNHKPFQDFLASIQDPDAKNKSSLFRRVLNAILKLIRGGDVALDSVLQRSFEVSVELASGTKSTEKTDSKAFFETQADADLAAADLSETDLDIHNFARGATPLSSEAVPVVSDQQIYEAIKANGGITVDVWTAGEPGTGIVVAPFKETETQIPLNDFKPDDVRAFLRKFRPLLEVPGMHLGGWIDDGTVYLDVSIVTDDEVTATALAQDGNQLAVYNIGTGEFPSTPELLGRNGGAVSRLRTEARYQNLTGSLQQAFQRAMGGLRGAGDPNVPGQGALPELGVIEALTGQPPTQDEINRIAESARYLGRNSQDPQADSENIQRSGESSLSDVSGGLGGGGAIEGGVRASRLQNGPSLQVTSIQGSEVEGKLDGAPFYKITSPEVYSKILDDFVAANPLGGQVTRKTPEQLAGAELYLTEDAGAGFAVYPTGEIGSLFAKENNGKAVMTLLRTLRKQSFGSPVYAASFNTKLVPLYSRVAGMVPVARLPWGVAGRTDGVDWDSTSEDFRDFESGKPSVVIWAFDPENAVSETPEGVLEKFPDFAPSYEEAVALAKSQSKVSGQEFNQESSDIRFSLPDPDQKFESYSGVIRYIEKEFGPKFKALKSSVEDSVAAYPKAAYMVIDGRGRRHYVSYNPLYMLEHTRAEVDAMMREELIHAASGLALMRKGIEWVDFYDDLGNSLSSEQRKRLKAVYTSAGNKAEIGAEYFRAGIQKLLYGRITETELRSRPMKKILALLMDFINYFKGRAIDPIVKDVYEDTVKIIRKVDKKNADQTSVLYSVSVPFKGKNGAEGKFVSQVLDKAVAEPAQSAFLKPEEFSKARETLSRILLNPENSKARARGKRTVNLNSPDDSTARRLEKITGQRWDGARKMVEARVIHALTEEDRATPDANKIATAPMVPQTLQQADFVARHDFEGRPFLIFAKLYSDPDSPTGVRWHFVEAREDTGAFETQYSNTDPQRGRALAAKVIGIGDSAPKKKKALTEAGYAQGQANENMLAGSQGILPVPTDQGGVLDNTNVESVQNKISEEIDALTEKFYRLVEIGNSEAADKVAEQIDELERQFAPRMSEPVEENLGTPEERVADAIDAANRSYANKSRFLLPEERNKQRSNTRETFVKIFNSLPSEKEFAAAAIGGQAKRGWYRSSSRAILEVFGADAPRFAALLAATSPQTSVENNLVNALNIWKNWLAAGKPTDRQAILRVMGDSVMGNKGENSVLDAWVNNSVRALTSTDPETLVISGPKVNSFMLNLRGVVNEVTNDAWMANFALVDQVMFKGSLNKAGTDPGKGPGYLAMSARVRAAAKYLTKITGEEWTPAEVQETVWSWAKTLYELQERQGESRTALEILQAGDLTDAAIASTPDFATLLNNGTYRQILLEAGYGDALGRLAQSNSGAVGETQRRFDPEAGSAIGKTLRTLQEKSARRLTRLYQQRQEESARKAAKSANSELPTEAPETLASGPVPFSGQSTPGFVPKVYTRADRRQTTALARVRSEPAYRSVQAALGSKGYFKYTEQDTLDKASQFLDTFSGDLRSAFYAAQSAHGLTAEQKILAGGLAMKRATAAANASRIGKADPNATPKQRVNFELAEDYYSGLAEDFAEELMEVGSLAGQELRAFRLLADTLAPRSWVRVYKTSIIKAQQRKFQGGVSVIQPADTVLKELMEGLRTARSGAAASTADRMLKALESVTNKLAPEGTTAEEIQASQKLARVLAADKPVRESVIEAAVERAVVSGVQSIRRAVSENEQVPEAFLREWENRLRKTATEQISAIIDARAQGGKVDEEAPAPLTEEEQQALREEKIMDAWRELSDIPLGEIVFDLTRSAIVDSGSPYAALVQNAQFDSSRATALQRAVKMSIDTAVEIRKSVADRRMSIEALKLRLEATNPGLSEEQMNKLAEAVETVYNEEVSKASTAALEKVVKAHKEKKTARKLTKDKSLVSRLMPLVNMGAFTDEAVYNAVSESLGLPTWNPETAAEIEAKAAEIQSLPEGSLARAEAGQRLMTDILKAHIKEARGLNKFGHLNQIASAFWSAGILSGPPTQIVNASMTSASVFVESYMEAIGYYTSATTKGYSQEIAREFFKDAARAWLFAFGKDASNTSRRSINEAYNSLTRGASKFKSEKLENMSPLEIFDFDPRVAIPGNAMMDALISGKLGEAAKEAMKMAVGVPIVMADRAVKRDMKGALKDLGATMKLVGRLMLAADAGNSYVATNAKQFMMQRYLLMEEGLSAEKVNSIMREIIEGGEISIKENAVAQAEDEAQRGDFGPLGTKSSEVQKARRIEQLIEQQTYGTDTIETGRDFAARASFNNDPYGVVGFLMDLLFAGPTRILGLATKPINPFPRTMSNLINAAVNYAPIYGSLRAEGWNLGSLAAALPRYPQQYYKAPPERGTPEYYALHARSTAGTVGTGLLVMMLAAAIKDRREDKEPWFEIHGPGPSDFEARKQWRDSGARPFSFRVGKVVVNYTDWPAANLLLGVLGTLYDQTVYSDEAMELDDWMWQTTRAVLLTTLNRNALGGTSAVFEIMSQTSSDKVVTSRMKGLAGSYVSGFTRPSFVRWVETIATETRQETKTSEGWLLSMMPFVSAFRGRPALNILGEPIEITPWDATAGRVATTRKTHPILTPLTDAQLWINPPKRYAAYDPNSKTGVRKMKESEFYDYSKFYGEALRSYLTKEQVTLLTSTAATAPNTAQRILNNYTQAAARVAKSKMLTENNYSEGKELKGP